MGPGLKAGCVLKGAGIRSSLILIIRTGLLKAYGLTGTVNCIMNDTGQVPSRAVPRRKLSFPDAEYL